VVGRLAADHAGQARRHDHEWHHVGGLALVEDHDDDQAPGEQAAG
jgi:hypothetical protein